MVEFDEVANAVNIEVYEKNGIRRPSEERHICVICGEPTSIDSSYSNNGDRLICLGCFRWRFDSPEKAFKWINPGFRWKTTLPSWQTSDREWFV